MSPWEKLVLNVVSLQKSYWLFSSNGLKITSMATPPFEHPSLVKQQNHFMNGAKVFLWACLWAAAQCNNDGSSSRCASSKETFYSTSTYMEAVAIGAMSSNPSPLAPISCISTGSNQREFCSWQIEQLLCRTKWGVDFLTCSHFSPPIGHTLQ